MKDLTHFSYYYVKRTNQNNPDERCAFCYADINGCPEDENYKNVLVCRVWLLKERDSDGELAYLIDWRAGEYCENTTVLQFIKRAKVDLADLKKQMIDELFQKVYPRYKLRWMIDRGYKLEDLMAGIQQKINDGASDVNKAFFDFQNYSGFEGGSMRTVWANIDTFRENEWKNDAYMKRLLTEQEYGIWLFK